MGPPMVWVVLALLVFLICVLMVVVFGFETRYEDELRERDRG